MVIKSLIKAERVDLIYLQETKVQFMSTSLVCNLGANKFLKWDAVISRQVLSGVLVL